jgi:membrane protein implicated in regulation of membrane protease activity
MQTFKAVWFAIGAGAALLISVMGLPFPLQLTCFILLSAVLLLGTRKMVESYFETKKAATVDTSVLVGEAFMVTEEINNIMDVGSIQINGKVWQARAECRTRFAPGALVKAVRFDGPKVFVEAYVHEEPAEELAEGEEAAASEELAPDPEDPEGAVYEPAMAGAPDFEALEEEQETV